MRKIILFLILALSMAASLSAKDKCLIVTPSWNERTNQDGTGYYFDIMRAVFEPVGYTVDYQIVPWKRAVLMVHKGDADLMLGVFYNPDSPDAARFVKWPFDIEETVVVYKKSRVSKWIGQKTLEHQKVLWHRGYNYYKFLDVKVDWSETDNVVTGLAMLAENRTKFFMVDRNGLLTMKASPLDENIYDIQVVLRQGLLPAFSKTVKGKQLAKVYDQNMPKLLESGKLKKIYEKYGKTMPELKPRK